MKILFTGGGSGGHFYPIIAIAEELRRIVTEERMIVPQLFYMAPEAYDERLLFENEIQFLLMPAGKLRRYVSVQNITDAFQTVWSICKACAIVFSVFPDVVVGKGGYGSFPALFAARLFKIPVLIHESDSVPGRVNKWAGKFARRIAISFPEAEAFFQKEKIAYTGHPMRKSLFTPEESKKENQVSFPDDMPVIALLGGSLGSVLLNEALISILPELLTTYAVIHQTGIANFEDVKARTGVFLQKHPNKNWYYPFPFLSSSLLADIGQRASIIISRAGSTIFEIAAWGKPSILIPISDSNGDHQRNNAYNYAKTGATIVIEESNLKPAILLREIRQILENPSRAAEMSEHALKFAKTDAATVIAREILEMALKHEKI